MYGIVQRVFPWFTATADSPAAADLTRGATSFSPPLPRHDVVGDRVSFWRRLLCTAEVSEFHRQNAPTAGVSKSRAPSVSTTFAASAATRTAADSHENGGAGTSPDLRSVFARPSHRFMPSQHDELPKSDLCASSGDSLVTSTCWVVLDTRRMATDFGDATDAPLSSPTASLCSSSSDHLLTLQRLKEAKREQVKQEALRKKDLQRDEEALLEMERQRLHSLAGRASFSLDDCAGESLPCGAAFREMVAPHEAATESVDASGLQSPTLQNCSIASTGDDVSMIECDDGIDIQELNRLYDFYKRRDEALTSTGTETKTAERKQKARLYPLHSRHYVERVILAQRSQQVIALMWLLSESMRNAWRLHVRLAQLYVYYVPMYLQTAAAAGCVHDAGVFSITQNRYYRYFCSSTFDYEYYMYQFRQEWDALFAAVKSYVSGETDGNVASATPGSVTPPGSIGFAATMLYSMELFERQHELQVAVREVENWVRLCWQHINGISTTTSNSTPPTTTEVPSLQVNSQEFSPVAPSSNEDVVNYGDNDESRSVTEGDGEAESSPLNQVDAAHDAASTISTEKAVYIPMDWWQAQDVDVQAHVSWNRKKRKLRVMRHGAAAMLKSRRRDYAVEHFTPPSTVAPQQEECFPAALDSTFSEDGSDEELQSHRIVNVGCFGFSFFSRWD